MSPAETGELPCSTQSNPQNYRWLLLVSHKTLAWFVTQHELTDTGLRVVVFFFFVVLTESINTHRKGGRGAADRILDIKSIPMPCPAGRTFLVHL